MDSDNSSLDSFPSTSTEDIWTHFRMYELFPRMEGTTLEFKQSIADLHQKKIPETLCGFLNTQGGSMIFGVRDDGQITGLSASRKQIDDFLLHIDRIFHEAIIRSTDTFQRVHPSCVRTEVLTCHNGKSVVIVTVTPSLETQYQTRDGSIWYRLNASNYKITGSEQLYTEMDIQNKILQVRKNMNKEFNKAIQGLQQNMNINESTIRHLEKTLQSQMGIQKKTTEQLDSLTELLFAKILADKVAAEQNLNQKSWLCGLF